MEKEINTQGSRGQAVLIRLTRLAGVVSAIAAILFIALWAVAMPPRNLEQPTGPYRVASLSYDLEDPSRPDPYSALLGYGQESRKFRVQLWFPLEPEALTTAASARGNQLPWITDGVKQLQGMLKAYGFPEFIWNHIAVSRSNSLDFYSISRNAGDTAASRESFNPGSSIPESLPVVLISHGWESIRGLHADVAEDLASHGYLVVAADHRFGAAATVLENGEVYLSDPRVLPLREEAEDFGIRASLLVQTFADDNAFILEHLEGVNQGQNNQGPPELSFLAGKLNAARLGLVGHSTGGGAMVRLSIDREAQGFPAPRALVGLDAWVEPVGLEDLLSGSYRVPSLFLRSGQWEGGINDGYLMPFVESLESQVRLYQIDDITHAQFSALHMFAPVLKWLGMIGDVDPFLFAQYQRAEILSFLDSVLRDVTRNEPEFPTKIPIFRN